MTKAVTLQKHIDDKHNGQVLKYAENTGYNFSMVYRWLSKGAYLIDGHKRPFLPAQVRGGK